MRKFWRSAGRWLPGVVISLIAIILIIKYVDLKRLVEAVKAANYWLLLVDTVVALVWLLVRGMVWRTLLRDRATFRQAFLAVCEGYLLNNFLPFRLGEIGRVFLLGRKAHLDFMEVLPTVVIERAVDLAISAVLLLGSIPFVVGANQAVRIAILLGVLVVLGLAALYFLARKRDWAMGIFTRLTSRSPKLQLLGGKFLMPLFTGLGILTNGTLFIRFLLWMVLNWVIGIGQYYLLILAFFPQAQVTWALFGLGVGAFANAIPSMPGAIGTFEGALGWALTLVSHNASAALAAAVTAHLYGYLISGAIGLYALATEGETLASIYHQLRRRQEAKL
jgi:glycosyltransferase 2 family protein